LQNYDISEAKIPAKKETYLEETAALEALEHRTLK